MFAFGTPRPRRRPSLTAMIDVVFLLLIFFMLAARFGVPSALPLTLSGGPGAWTGPPRLVTVGAQEVRLNGLAVGGPLAEALAPLMESPADPVVLRAAEGVALQRLVTVMEELRAAGLSSLVVVE